MTALTAFTVGMPLSLVVLTAVQLSRAYKAAAAKMDPKVAYFVAVGTFFCVWFSGAVQAAAAAAPPADYEMYAFSVGPILFAAGLMMTYVHELSTLAGTTFMFLVGSPTLKLAGLVTVLFKRTVPLSAVKQNKKKKKS